MGDSEGLWAAVQAAPDDDLPKLVLADFLDENEQSRSATALRWCVAHKRWPRITARQSLYVWYTDPSMEHPGKPAEIERAMLPLAFMVVGQLCERCADFPDKVGGGGVAYRSLPHAIDYLGYILAQLRWLIDAKIPSPDKAIPPVREEPQSE